MVKGGLRVLGEASCKNLHLVPLCAHVVDVLREAHRDPMRLGRHVVSDDEDAQVGLFLIGGCGVDEARDGAAKLGEEDNRVREARARHEDEHHQRQLAQAHKRQVALSSPVVTPATELILGPLAGGLVGLRRSTDHAGRAHL